MKDQYANVNKWALIVRKIWDDPDLKKELLADPRKFLTEKGLEFPESQTIEIHENTEQTLHLILPEKPPREIPDEILSHIVAGI